MLSHCLDASSVEITAWMVVGVPRSRDADVARLARRASTLRRRLPAETAFRLLALSHRGIESAQEIRNALRRTTGATERAAGFRVARSAAGIVITSR